MTYLKSLFIFVSVIFVFLFKRSVQDNAINKKALKEKKVTIDRIHEVRKKQAENANTDVDVLRDRLRNNKRTGKY